MIELGTKEVVELVRDFLKPIGNTAADAWGAWVGDRVQAYRLRNQLELRKRTIETASRLGLSFDAKRLSDKFAFEWIEESSKHDDETIQQMFATLLIKAADADSATDPDPRHVGMLSQLTPADAQLFARLFSQNPFLGMGGYSQEPGLITNRRGYKLAWLLAMLGGDATQAKRSLDNLSRIGVISLEKRLQVKQGVGKVRVQAERDGTVNLPQLIEKFSEQVDFIISTELGKSFYGAVVADEPKS